MDMVHVGFIEATEIQKRLHESSLEATGLDSSYTEKERRISYTIRCVDIDCFKMFGLEHEACTYLIIYFNQLTHIILYTPQSEVRYDGLRLNEHVQLTSSYHCKSIRKVTRSEEEQLKKKAGDALKVHPKWTN